MIETKVAASTAMSALVLLALYALGKLEFVQDMDETVKGALGVVLLALFTFIGGYIAKHTPRPDLGEAPQPGIR